jgi:hypothetical protein
MTAMPLELAWSSELEEVFDLKNFANGVLERAKESLQKDGYLQSGVFIITDTEVQCYSVSFSGHEEKEATYGEVVGKARDLNALAIVTLNDAFLGDKCDPEKYVWGQAASNPKGECILVTISGPGMKNCTKEIEYHRTPEGIEFEASTEDEDSSIGILQEWSSLKAQRVN